jgi:putative ABC transport system permease protein
MRQDFAYAIRSLRRKPGFAVLVVAVLAIGIACATAIANVYTTVLLRRLPVRDQDRIVAMWGKHRAREFDRVPLSARGYRIFREENRSLSSVAATDYNGALRRLFRRQGEPLELVGLPVSGEFFEVLGASAFLGRTLRPDDDVAGAPPNIVIGHATWQKRFGGDSAILGRSMQLVANGALFTIVGVMPAGFDYPRGTEFWGPIAAMSPDQAVHVVGRLVPGATTEAAGRELSTFFAQEPSPLLRGATGSARTLPDLLVGDVRPALRILAIAVGLLLLVSCVNVANLFLIRGVERAREMAVRSALGAGRRRLVRQLLTESSILAVSAGIVGAALAIGLVRLLVAAAPAELPRLDEIRTSGAASWAVLATVLATLLFGVAPAFVTARDTRGSLIGASRWGTGGTEPRSSRIAKDILVAAQLALAIVILASAGLVSRSVQRLQHLDVGYTTDHLLVAQLGWPSEKYTEVSRAIRMFDALVATLGSTPGVVSASTLLTGPFSGTGGWDGMFVVENTSVATGGEHPILNMEVGSPEFFATLEIPVREGRRFTAGDRRGTQHVVAVSEGAARTLWPNQSAIGKRLKLGTRSTEWWTVVGVVGDTRYREFRTARPTVYFPLQQLPFPFPPTMIVVRTAADPVAMAATLRRTVAAIDRDLVVASTSTMTALLDAPLAQPRLNARLLTLFAAVVLALAGVGLYGVLAWTVRQRTRELGIRLALGAQPGQLHYLVVRRGMLIAAAGTAMGLVGAVAASRAMGALLFEISPTDPATLAATCALLLVVAFAACITPARRATRVDPMLTLRSE